MTRVHRYSEYGLIWHIRALKVYLLIQVGIDVLSLQKVHCNVRPKPSAFNYHQYPTNNAVCGFPQGSEQINVLIDAVPGVRFLRPSSPKLYIFQPSVYLGWIMIRYLACDVHGLQPSVTVRAPDSEGFERPWTTMCENYIINKIFVIYLCRLCMTFKRLWLNCGHKTTIDEKARLSPSIPGQTKEAIHPQCIRTYRNIGLSIEFCINFQQADASGPGDAWSVVAYFNQGTDCGVKSWVDWRDSEY